jgi:hypothetical protein
MNGAKSNGAPRAAVEQELNRVLQSPHFRTSRRSQQFLRYVVEHTLTGQDDHLKERAIGAAIFDRAPDYDTGEDASVRVAANEVRKRLAQYQIETPPPEVRIEVPAGGYHAEFHWVAPASLPAADPAPSGGRWWRWAAACLVLALAAGASTLLLRSSPAPETVFDQFWRPLVNSREPVLICLANPMVYLLADPLPPLLPGGERPSSPADPRDLDRRGILESPDQYVGVGDAYAASHFAALFSKLGKPAQVRIGNEVSFADLRDSAAVLIGAYSNRWSMQMNAEYRYGFARYSIVDRQEPDRVWRLGNLRPGYRSDEDYLLISRILTGYSGEPVVMAAGITHAGTQAAGELLTRPDALEAILRDAPPDWYRKNLQLVLHCKVVGLTPRPPTLVASHYW